MQHLTRLPFTIFLLSLACGTTESPSSRLDGGVSKQEFTRLINDISEPNGFFDSDNYISNETDYPHILPEMDKIGIKGGVYIGVGPDQNYSYIARIRPSYAFIIDLRRGNLIQHLLYKVILKMAESRQEFLSILLSKPLEHLTDTVDQGTIAALVDKFDRLPGSRDYLDRNFSLIKHKLAAFDLKITEDDYTDIEEIMIIFYERHLDLRWEWRSPWRRGLHFPTYREILLAKDLNGAYGNFLNTNRDFEFIKKMHADNRIVPVVGDFSGVHALSQIADYTRSKNEYVSAFYLSNVEFYLIPNGVMHQFAMNVKQLPINEKSILIRAFVNMRWGRHPATVGNHMMTTTMQYIKSFNQLYSEGTYQTYWDVGTRDYIDHSNGK
ncbi:MAG: hypothetical protein VYA69_05440 [Gemmatimonadota bacterium]|nr:hypothetical protein [Gemmatimonadota bacterium]